MARPTVLRSIPDFVIQAWRMVRTMPSGIPAAMPRHRIVSIFRVSIFLSMSGIP